MDAERNKLNDGSRADSLNEAPAAWRPPTSKAARLALRRLTAIPLEMSSIERIVRCFGVVAVVAISTFVTAACSGDGGTAPDPEPASVSITPSSIELTALGEQAQLVASALDPSGRPITTPVAWSTSNSAVANVSNGSVTATGPGTATITAATKGRSANAQIVVRQTPHAVSINRAADTLRAINATRQLTAIVEDRRGAPIANEPVLWRSSLPSVATVSGSGLVTALTNGTTVISAESAGLTKTISIVVEQSVATLSIVEAPATLNALGHATTYTARAVDGNGSVVPSPQLEWVSSSPTVATVVSAASQKGMVTAAGVGVSTIEVRSGASKASVTVTVRQVPAQIQITPGSITIQSVITPASVIAVVADSAGRSIPSLSVAWATEQPGIVSATSSGSQAASVTGISPGATRITASSGSLSASIPVTVAADATVIVESIDPFLAQPATGNIWEIPVLVVRYLPTVDGVNVDINLTAFPRPASHPGGPATLKDLRARIDVFDRRSKFMLEEGSKFRGYANPNAIPSLGYRVVRYVTIYEPMPLGPVAGQCVPGECVGTTHFPDYHAVLRRVNAEHWVNAQGVKEIWVWGYHYGKTVQPESNMSSALTGDISNSFRANDDLPIYNRTFTLYGLNFARAHTEVVHNHGHQLEALLQHVDQTQNFNTELFWDTFVGRDAGKWITGRAGWTHMPPNTTQDYDYLNRTPVSSDIEDWRPDGSGVKTMISADRWRNLVYSWPSGTIPAIDGRAEDHSQGSDTRAGAQWFIYWFQNMPGRSNSIPMLGGQMTNWWQFTGDWDAAMTSRAGLATVANGQAVPIKNDFIGSVLLEPVGTLQPGQEVLMHITKPTQVRLYSCGASGCAMVPYSVSIGKSYRVIAAVGEQYSIKLVER